MIDYYSIIQLQLELDELVQKINRLNARLTIVDFEGLEKEWSALVRELSTKSNGRLSFRQVSNNKFVLDIFGEDDPDEPLRVKMSDVNQALKELYQENKGKDIVSVVSIDYEIIEDEPMIQYPEGQQLGIEYGRQDLDPLSAPEDDADDQSDSDKSIMESVTNEDNEVLQTEQERDHIVIDMGSDEESDGDDMSPPKEMQVVQVQYDPETKSFVPIDTTDTEEEEISDAESLDLEAMTSEEVTELMNSIMASDLVKEEGIASEFDRTQESNEGCANQVCELTWDQLQAEVGAQLKKRCKSFCWQLKKITAEVQENIDTLEELVEAMTTLCKIIEENSGWIKQDPSQESPTQNYEQTIKMYKFLIADAKSTLGFVTQLAESLPHLEEGPEPGWPWEECRPFPNAWA